MIQLGPPVLAFVIASFIAVLELITSKYPRTFFLLKNCSVLYIYGLIYGVIGFAVMLGLNYLVSHKAVTLEGFGLSNPWWQAVAVGLSVKAFLHLRIFSVGVGPQSFPIGTETIMQLFEPWLLRTTELYHFNAGRHFIASRALKYPVLDDVKTKTKANIPGSFSSTEKAAFVADVDKAPSVDDAMELFINFLGKSTFDRVFPP
jgi:hypothetical protein